MSDRLGLIARCDGGGLGSLTWEFWQRLRPARTLVLTLGGAGRVYEDPGRYSPGRDDVRVAQHPADLDAYRWLCEGSDVIYTAETPYHPELFAIARARGVRTVLHAMPELFGTDCEGADEVWIPTHWERDRLADVDPVVVPVPVAMNVTRRRRNRIRTLYHVASPAMLDRNGTELLLGALEQVRHPMHAIIRTPAPIAVPRCKNASIELRPPTRNYADAWPSKADVFVMPRRYGGLSLLAQEAAARGMPLVLTMRAPDEEWPAAHVPVRAVATARMKGSRDGRPFQIESADAGELAALLDATYEYSPNAVSAWSDESLAWASEIGWPALEPLYRALLGIG